MEKGESFKELILKEESSIEMECFDGNIKIPLIQKDKLDNSILQLFNQSKQLFKKKQLQR
jgi:hypothetical protein